MPIPSWKTELKEVAPNVFARPDWKHGIGELKFMVDDTHHVPELIEGSQFPLDSPDTSMTES